MAVSAGLGVSPEDLGDAAQEHAGNVRPQACTVSTSLEKTHQIFAGCIRSGDNIHSRRLREQDRRQSPTAPPRKPAIQARLRNRHHRNILRLLHCLSACGRHSPHWDTMAI